MCSAVCRPVRNAVVSSTASPNFPAGDGEGKVTPDCEIPAQKFPMTRDFLDSRQRRYIFPPKYLLIFSAFKTNAIVSDSLSSLWLPYNFPSYEVQCRVVFWKFNNATVHCPHEVQKPHFLFLFKCGINCVINCNKTVLNLDEIQEKVSVSLFWIVTHHLLNSSWPYSIERYPLLRCIFLALPSSLCKHYDMLRTSMPVIGVTCFMREKEMRSDCCYWF